MLSVSEFSTSEGLLFGVRLEFAGPAAAGFVSGSLLFSHPDSRWGHVGGATLFLGLVNRSGNFGFLCALGRLLLGSFG
ncbi:unnamed protein product [Amoebophrya sp. A120]|nr:unnamed protein product [Amoebophrya sp. A120]|eukprot:GSA120T00026275001.1